MIQVIMASLKMPEWMQSRIFEYSEFENGLKYVKNEHFYKNMTETLKSTVKLFQTEQAIRKMGLFDQNNTNQIESFANIIQVAIFLPNDVIVKQGDIGDNFYIIIDGKAEVCSEKKDFLFFDFKST